MIVATLLFLVILVFAFGFWRFRRSTKAVLRPEDFDRKAIDTWECRVAVHEAGHAAAAWCCTLVAAVNVATIENTDGGGVVKYSFLNVPSPDAAWCRAVISLAGVAAEAHVYARWKTRGAEADISGALELAHAARGHVPPWERLRGKNDLGFQKMFTQKIEPEDLAFLEESFHMARRILRAHGSDFFRLVSALLAMRTARELHLEPVLGRRRAARLALFGADVERVVSGESRLFKARFILPLKRHFRRAA